MITENYFSASDLIIAYLKSVISEVPDANFRQAPSDIWVTKNPLSPSINVIMFDDQALESGEMGNGKTQVARQFWMLILSLHDVSNAAEGRINEAGMILLKLLKAMQGYKLSKEHQSFHRRAHQFRKSFVDGYLHYPLVFSCDVTV